MDWWQYQLLSLFLQTLVPGPIITSNFGVSAVIRHHTDTHSSHKQFMTLYTTSVDVFKRRLPKLHLTDHQHWRDIPYGSLLIIYQNQSHLLVVPRFQLDTYGRRTFAVAGPATWNLFRNNLHDLDMQIDCFCRTLKTFLFEQHSAHRTH